MSLSCSSVIEPAKCKKMFNFYSHFSHRSDRFFAKPIEQGETRHSTIYAPCVHSFLPNLSLIWEDDAYGKTELTDLVKIVFSADLPCMGDSIYGSSWNVAWGSLPSVLSHDNLRVGTASLAILSVLQRAKYAMPAVSTFIFPVLQRHARFGNWVVRRGVEINDYGRCKHANMHAAR